MTYRWTRFAGLTLAFCFFSVDVSASEFVQPSLAMNDLSEVDADYPFQGEYAGALFTGSGSSGWEDLGLQVIAQGNGEFSGVLYRGGLPGRGWAHNASVALQGSRRNGALELLSSGVRVEVESHHAIIWVNRQQLGGFLPRVLRVSRTMHAQPPAGARVLFDGSDALQFVGGQITGDGLLMEGADTLDAFGNFTLHIEFRLPYMPHARGQARGNSGVYLQSRYEVQILDSFGLEGVANQCGGLYRQRAPDVNMCLPPLTWQTYDIKLTSPRFLVDGSKLENGRVSVWHNGVLIHNDVELADKTGAGKPEGSLPLPTRLQDHGDPVRFRNIWLVEHGVVPSSGISSVVSIPPTTSTWPAERLKSKAPWSAPEHRSRILYPGSPGAF